MFALIRPVMTSTLGRCVASDQVDPDRPGHLRQARDRLFDLAAFHRPSSRPARQ